MQMNNLKYFWVALVVFILCVIFAVKYNFSNSLFAVLCASISFILSLYLGKRKDALHINIYGMFVGIGLASFFCMRMNVPFTLINMYLVLSISGGIGFLLAPNIYFFPRKN